MFSLRLLLSKSIKSGNPYKIFCKNFLGEGGIQFILHLIGNKELAYIDMKLSLARLLKNRRKQKGLTQQELADQLSTSQSRVANMENGDPKVTVDLLIKALLALDVDRSELGKTIQEPMPA